jgi:hypothetical protein
LHRGLLKSFLNANYLPNKLKNSGLIFRLSLSTYFRIKENSPRRNLLNLFTLAGSTGISKYSKYNLVGIRLEISLTFSEINMGGSNRADAKLSCSGFITNDKVFIRGSNERESALGSSIGEATKSVDYSTGA